MQGPWQELRHVKGQVHIGTRRSERGTTPGQGERPLAGWAASLRRPQHPNERARGCRPPHPPETMPGPGAGGAAIHLAKNLPGRSSGGATNYCVSNADRSHSVV